MREGFTGSVEIYRCSHWTFNFVASPSSEQESSRDSKGKNLNFPICGKNLFALALCSMRVTLEWCMWCCCCWHATIFLLFVSHLFTLYFLNIVDTLHNNLCYRRSIELKHLRLNFALATTTTWGKSSFVLFTLYAHSTVETADGGCGAQHTRMKWSENSHFSECARVFAKLREKQQEKVPKSK